MIADFAIEQFGIYREICEAAMYLTLRINDKTVRFTKVSNGRWTHDYSHEFFDTLPEAFEFVREEVK